MLKPIITIAAFLGGAALTAVAVTIQLDSMAFTTPPPPAESAAATLRVLDLAPVEIDADARQVQLDEIVIEAPSAATVAGRGASAATAKAPPQPKPCSGWREVGARIHDAKGARGKRSVRELCF